MHSICINIFSTKVLIVDTVVRSPTEDETTISRALPTELILLRSLLYRVGLCLATGLLCFSAAQNDRLFFLLEFVQLVMITSY